MTKKKKFNLEIWIGQEIDTGIGSYNIPITVRLAPDQVKQLDLNSSNKYGKPKRSTYIREILEKHFFKV